MIVQWLTVLAIKRTIEDLYTVYLPKKGHPWCYLSLQIDPQNVDVNIHPTKHEVRFLHEDIIIEKIKIAVDEKLAASNSSRTFYFSSKLPKLDLTDEIMEKTKSDSQQDEDKDKNKKIAPKYMIRTSSTDQKLDKFNFTKELVDKNIAKLDNALENLDNVKKLLHPEKSIMQDIAPELEKAGISVMKSAADMIATDRSEQPHPAMEILERDKLEKSSIQNVRLDLNENGNIDESRNNNGTNAVEQPNLDVEMLENDTGCSKKIIDENEAKQNMTPENRPPVEFKSYSANQIQVETKLLSILTLRKEVEDTYHDILRDILSNLIYVGCESEGSYAFIQSGTKLYLTNVQKLV